MSISGWTDGCGAECLQILPFQFADECMSVHALAVTANEKNRHSYRGKTEERG